MAQISVDDGSADATARILHEYAARDTRLTILRNARPLGIAAALNRGVAASRAPLVARMDADDVSVPDRFARQKAFLDARPHVVLCGGTAEFIDRAGAVTGSWTAPTGYATIRGWLLRGNCFVHGSVMIRRRELDDAGGYSTDPAYRHAEDYKLWVRLAARYDVDNVPAPPLYAYRAYPRDRGRDYGRIQEASAERVRQAAARLLPGAAAPPGRIFVLIASYRDPDCQWTIKDLFSSARAIPTTSPSAWRSR